MKAIVHRIAGTVALLSIATFWMSTIISEVLLNHEAVLAVKQAIVYGLFLLVPAIAITGISGFLLGKRRNGNLTVQKKKRMRFIVANGLLVLIPCALFLNGKAAASEFDMHFYAVQFLELVVGMVQIILMSLNFRDGRTLAGKTGIHPFRSRSL